RQVDEAKSQLLCLARYERTIVDAACAALLESLEKNSKGPSRIGNAIKLFVGVTKFYADLYVARDVTNRVK
ncbi:MAG: hypothetical protein Q9218_008260, partial [Villophora microphyllina]